MGILKLLHAVTLEEREIFSPSNSYRTGAEERKNGSYHARIEGCKQDQILGACSVMDDNVTPLQPRRSEREKREKAWK